MIKEQDYQQKDFKPEDKERQRKSELAQKQAEEKSKSLEKKVTSPGAGEVTVEKKEAKKKKKSGATILPDGSGFFTGTVENHLRVSDNILSTYLEYVQEVSPPGWEGSIKKMKKKRGIKNPWALGWWMKKKGYSPSYTKSGKKKK